jgi:ferrous iron transport protein A
MHLNELSLKTSATIVSIEDTAAPDVQQRLIEMGVLPNQQVEVVHKAPVGGDPIAVRISNNLVGIGLQEAKLIKIVTP